MQNAKIIKNSNVKIKNSFWEEKQELVRKEVIPYQRKALEDGVDGAEPSRCMENFRKAAKAKEQRNRGTDTPVFPPTNGTIQMIIPPQVHSKAGYFRILIYTSGLKPRHTLFKIARTKNLKKPLTMPLSLSEKRRKAMDTATRCIL